MRGKTNLGSSSGYLINGIKRSCVISGDDISKGDFVIAHNEPGACDVLTAETGSAAYFRSLHELSDGNYLYAIGSTLFVYDNDTDTRTTAILYCPGASRTLTRIGSGKDDFIYIGANSEYVSSSSKYRLTSNLYVLHYDASTKAVSQRSIYESYYWDASGFRYTNDYNDIFVYDSKILINQIFEELENSNSVQDIRAGAITGSSYDDYKFSSYGGPEISSGFGSKTFGAIANSNYMLTYINSTPYVSDFDYASIGVYNYTGGQVFNFNVNSILGSEIYIIPLQLVGTTMYTIVVDRNRKLYLGHVDVSSQTGGKTDLDMTLASTSAYVEYLVGVKPIQDLGAVVTIISSSGDTKRAWFSDGKFGNFDTVYTANANANYKGIDYIGEYDDNFLLFEYGAMNSTDANQNIVRSLKIINNELVPTEDGKNYVTKATNAKYINGVANGAGEDGDTIQVIVSNFDIMEEITEDIEADTTSFSINDEGHLILETEGNIEYTVATDGDLLAQESEDE